ncbi:MAG: hypothetical protein GEU99_04005 [Luteitalea sp.]|nr:hypothetical protein [Luteitalea sp.]
MKRPDQRECHREPELVEAIIDGRWPEGCDETLRQHVGDCAVCAEVAEIAPLLNGEHTAACHEAGPPPVGAVWWRLEARARREAMLRATRPILWTQGLAAACVVGLALGVLPLTLEVLGDWDAWLYQSAVLPEVSGVVTSWFAHLDHENIQLALIGCVSVALLIPLALYLALSEE